MTKLLAVLALVTSCVHTDYKTETVVLKTHKTENFDQPVRKDFIIMMGHNNYCDTDGTYRKEVETFTIGNRMPFDDENNLLMSFGSAVCKEKSITITSTERTYYKNRLLGIEPLMDGHRDTNSEDKITQLYDQGFEEKRAPKFPKDGTVTFEVDGKEEKFDFKTVFDEESNKIPFARIPFPKILTEALAKRNEEGKEYEKVILKVTYKTAFMTYEVVPEPFKTKCESIIEGEEASEKNCKSKKQP